VEQGVGYVTYMNVAPDALRFIWVTFLISVFPLKPALEW
jgi:hypothetical protein